MTIEELHHWAEKMAEAARQGVQVERMWQKKLEQEQAQSQQTLVKTT